MIQSLLIENISQKVVYKPYYYYVLEFRIGFQLGAFSKKNKQAFKIVVITMCSFTLHYMHLYSVLPQETLKKSLLKKKIK